MSAMLVRYFRVPGIGFRMDLWIKNGIHTTRTRSSIFLACAFSLDRPIDRAAGTRRRHICPLKEPIICSYLLGERNVSFEKRTQARTAQRRDCPGLVLQMAFSLIDESPEKRSAENLPQILTAVFENTALNKKTLP